MFSLFPAFLRGKRNWKSKRRSNIFLLLCRYDTIQRNVQRLKGAGCVWREWHPVSSQNRQLSTEDVTKSSDTGILNCFPYHNDVGIFLNGGDLHCSQWMVSPHQHRTVIIRMSRARGVQTVMYSRRDRSPWSTSCVFPLWSVLDGASESSTAAFLLNR